MANAVLLTQQKSFSNVESPIDREELRGKGGGGAGVAKGGGGRRGEGSDLISSCTVAHCRAYSIREFVKISAGRILQAV